MRFQQLMVRTIHIENYKSITTLDLELGRVNVLIGANGSGKTNLLEGIVLGSAAAAGKLDNEFLATRGMRVIDGAMKSGFKKDSQNSPCLFWLYSDSNPIATISVKVSNFDIKEVELNISYTINLANGIPQDDKDIVEMATKMNFDNDNALKDWHPNQKEIRNLLHAEYTHKVSKKIHLDTFLLYAPENHFLRLFEKDAQIRPLGIRGEGLFSHLAELYREKPEQFKEIVAEVQELTDWVDNIEIPNDLIFSERRLRISDRYLQEGLAFIDQRSSNEGFLYLLFYITLLVSDRTPKFFAIDNVDNALNPKLCRKLMEVISRLAVEHDKQVILTAHNPGLLDGLNINDPEQRLFVLSRNADGHTKALRLDKKPSANGNGQVRLSEQFLRGYIGGLPDDF